MKAIELDYLTRIINQIEKIVETPRIDKVDYFVTGKELIESGKKLVESEREPDPNKVYFRCENCDHITEMSVSDFEEILNKDE